MYPDPKEPRQRRPWAGFGYLILVVVAIIVAWFVVWPIGQAIRNTFQTLTNALGGHV